MKIGLVLYGRLQTLTGGYLYDRLLVEHLERSGHQVDRISLPVRRYFWRLADNLSPRLYRRLSTGPYDVVIQDELCHASLALMNRRLRRHIRYPLITLVHQVLCDEPRGAVLNRLYACVERPYLGSVDGFIFNSRTTRKTVAELTRRRRPGVVAMPAGDRLGTCRSPEDFVLRAERPGPLHLLFLGNVIPRKGLLPLLRELRDVPFATWRLTVVGSLEMDPSYSRRVAAFIRANGLQSQVQCLGAREGEELAAIVAASHLLTMPYAYEGFGIVLLEAMAFGVPPIASRRGAAWETIDHGDNGFLLSPGDGTSLKRIITDLHADRPRLLRLSQAAWHRFQHHPRWQDSMKRIESFLLEQTGAHGKAQHQ